MNTELTEAQRADIRQMARDVMADKDGLAQIDRDIIGYSSVRVNLPLSDTVAMAKHLAILSEAIDRARVAFAAAIAPCPAPCDPRRVKARFTQPQPVERPIKP